jgi:cytochrome c oxidase cbb3-type subunit 2
VAGLAAHDRGTLTLAGWLYPVGVSLYSTALVAWPAWFGGAAEPRAAARRAAWLFAIAGWLASANGIGMAETLRRVPVGFVLAAGAVVLGAAWFSGTGKWRAALGAAVILAAVGIGNRFRHNPTALSPAERGRQVYLAEGCIHCHSQFIRPGTLDEQLWGMAASTRDVLATTPVLIGNRRQGPDLANAGARRSAAWLREHFINPQLLIPGSAMPAYPHLFNDHRGADLIAYLQTIGNRVPGPNLTVSSNWRPQTAERPDPAAGGRLFARWCAVCHGDSGRGDGKLARRFVKPPANLADGPLLWTAATEQRELKVARIIKFGIPGTDMPGHEVLTDTQISDLTAYVLRLHDKRSVLAW